MKKLFLCAAVVLAAVAGTVCYHCESRNENEMSDLAKANVKALAEEVKIYCCSDNELCTGEYCGTFIPANSDLEHVKLYYDLRPIK